MKPRLAVHRPEKWICPTSPLFVPQTFAPRAIATDSSACRRLGPTVWLIADGWRIRLENSWRQPRPHDELLVMMEWAAAATTTRAGDMRQANVHRRRR